MPSSDTQFQPGGEGGPGRPKGARNKLSEAFIGTLADDFAEHGPDVIIGLRRTNPVAYCNVIARLMPKLMELSDPDGQPLTLRAYVYEHPASVDPDPDAA